MKNLIMWAGLVCCVLLTGCSASSPKTAEGKPFSNVRVRSSFSPGAQFPVDSRYAFMQFPSEDKEEAEVFKINQWIQAALSTELEGKGFKPVQSADDIDFFVVYSLGMEHHTEIVIDKGTILIGMSEIQGSEWSRKVVTPNDYVNGALFVQIVDAEKMKPVWLGAFNAEIVLESISDQEKEKRVNYAVSKLLQKFPPQ